MSNTRKIKRQSLLQRMLTNFDRRHDETSIRRQRTIATLVIFADIILIVLSAVAIMIWNWRFAIDTVPAAFGLGIGFVAIACLLTASSLYPAFANFTRTLATWPTDDDSAEPTTLAKARKFLFYPGMYLNFAAICILVEQSGGIVHSPFTPVLFGMVLGAQQLGRFRTNSAMFIGFGIGVTVLMFVVEHQVGIRPVAPPPRSLEFYLLASTFLMTALFTHSDKAKNYRAAKGFPAPIRVDLYRDGDGLWRYSFYGKHSRLDAVLEGMTGNESIEDAKESVQRRLFLFARPEVVENATINWQDSTTDREAIGSIKYPRRSANS